MTMTRPTVQRLRYQPALDGLRAIAILMVMLGHSHPRLLGGQLGVDVFFALSGFLITTLIIEEFEEVEAGVSLRNFYARRSLRLFPGLYVMLVLLGAYLVARWDSLPALMAPSGGHRSDLGLFFVGAATYTTNLLGIAGRPGNLLGHTWSLAVEEQFYLLWPGVLLFALRRRTTLLAALVATFWVFCFAARSAGVDALRGFLWARPDTILLGCAAAIARTRTRTLASASRGHGNLVAAVSIGGIGVIAVSVSTVTNGTALDRGLTSIVGALAVALVLVLVDAPECWLARVLRHPWLVWLGVLSYSLYLWHQPIFRLLAWETRSLNQTPVLVVKWVLSLVAAVASYYVVERPARRLQARFRRQSTGEALPAEGVAPLGRDGSAARADGDA